MKMQPFAGNVLAIGLSVWASEYVIDRFVIRSDSSDPEGFVLQSEGFGLDDIIRLTTYGIIGAAAVGAMKGL